MDCSNRMIYPSMDEALKKGALKENLKEIEDTFLGKTIQVRLEKNMSGQIGMRSRCPCGSGKRFKSCCWTGRKK